MNVTNIEKAKDWFEVLQTSGRSQTAMMTLAPGQSTGQKAKAHAKSDQVLLMLEGELTGEVGDERPTLTGRRNHDSSRRETSLHESDAEAGCDF
jgi:mannose-6-phosphate isomerase-like protein (cupin superfamily)